MKAPLGVVLAGGLARRMGGGDKARLQIAGRTILERVLARMQPQCSALILNANGDTGRFADTRLAVVPDSVPDFAGPLAGILAGLDWAATEATDVADIVTVPGDCPFLPEALVARVACRGDRRHALVAEGLRKIEAWTARHGVAVADWPAAPIDPFFNINTPDDAADAERIAVQHCDDGGP